jgi:nucleoside-diphosphate-sugar epimerase
MRVAVTGALGKIGSVTVSELLAHGYDVIAIDRIADRQSTDAAPVEHRAADLADPEATCEVLAGCQALLHLAAFTDPVSRGPPIVFANNASGTFNILHAAERRGIGRAVCASSQCALGHPWAKEVLPLDYAPVDEEHPCRPVDPYALSKVFGETTCDYFARRAGMQILSYRFPSVWLPDQYPWRPNVRLTDLLQAAKSMWAYVDVRDAARACRLALERDWQGHQILNITSRWAIGVAPVPQLLAQWYPTLKEIRAPLEDCTAVFDWHKAERVLGFRARYRWLPEGIIDTEGME